MTQSFLTEKQESKLAEALEIALLFEGRAKELSAQGEVFAEKWDKRLREAEQLAELHEGIPSAE